MPDCSDRLDISQLAAAYRSGKDRPIDVVSGVLERISHSGNNNIWIDLVPRARLEARAAELELWEMPARRFSDFVDGIPEPLGIGMVELENGEQVRGFLCEQYATNDAREITEQGSWRTHVEQRANSAATN